MAHMTWENVGKRIKELRRDRKLTQAQFGKLIGLSRQHVGKIEKGQTLSVDQIAIICEETGVSADYIIFGIVDPLANHDLLDDLTREQIDISLDVLKEVAKLIKAKNGNALLIKELMRRHRRPAEANITGK